MFENLPSHIKGLRIIQASEAQRNNFTAPQAPPLLLSSNKLAMERLKRDNNTLQEELEATKREREKLESVLR